MKRLIVALFIWLLYVIPLFAEESYHGLVINTEKPVMLYGSPYGNDISVVIQQCYDSDFTVDVQYLETGKLRFKVKINFDIGGEEFEGVEGWLNKVDCKVFVLESFYEDEKGYFWLYERPDKSSPRKKIEWSYDYYEAVVLDISEDWYQVMFNIDGKIVTGWPDRVCSNIYVSCN